MRTEKTNDQVAVNGGQARDSGKAFDVIESRIAKNVKA